jgi:hypothetical protein
MQEVAGNDVAVRDIMALAVVTQHWARMDGGIISFDLLVSCTCDCLTNL